MYVYCLSFMGGVVCGAGVWLLGGWFVLMEGWQVSDFVQLLGMRRRGG